MKLILCSRCRDILKLIFRPRTCACGKSSGYCDEHGTAHFAGPANPIEISDLSIKSALDELPNGNGTPSRLIAWMVPQQEVARKFTERTWHVAKKKRKGKSRRPHSKHAEPRVRSRHHR